LNIRSRHTGRRLLSHAALLTYAAGAIESTRPRRPKKQAAADWAARHEEEIEAAAEGLAAGIETLSAQFRRDQERDDRRGRITLRREPVLAWLHAEAPPPPFDCRLQRDFAYLALFDPSVLEVRFRRTAVPLPGGKTHVPDFMVRYTGPDHCLHEASVDVAEGTVRPSPRYGISDPGGDVESVDFGQHLGDGDIDRLDRLRASCRAAGTTYHHLTELQIRGPHLETVKALCPFRFPMAREDMAMTMAVYAKAREAAPCPVGRLLEEFPDEPVSAQLSLWHLLALGQLFVDLREPLTLGTSIATTPVWSDPALFFTARP